MVVLGVDHWRDNGSCGNISGHVDSNSVVAGKMVMVESEHCWENGCVIGGEYWE